MTRGLTLACLRGLKGMRPELERRKRCKVQCCRTVTRGGRRVSDQPAGPASGAALRYLYCDDPRARMCGSGVYEQVHLSVETRHPSR